MPTPLAETTTKRFPPWGVPAALTVVFATYVVSQLIGYLLVSIYPLINGWSQARAEAWLSSSTLAQFTYILIVEVLTVGLIYLYAKRHKVSLQALGLHRPRWRDGALALALVPVYLLGYLGLVLIAQALAPSLNVEQEQQIGFEQAKGPILLTLTFISLAVLPPIAEEILMRGFLFESLKKHMKVVGAALVTSVIFAVAHLQFGSDAPLLWIAAIDTFVLSLVLCYLKQKTGSLWAGIFLHALKNTVAFLSLFIFHLR